MNDLIDPATPAPADRLECDRLLNTWLRECFPGQISSMMRQPVSDGQPILELPLGAMCLRATWRRVSPSGFHGFDSITIEDAAGERRAVTNPTRLAEILLGQCDTGTSAARTLVRERIEASIEASRGHAAFLSERPPASTAEAMEQSLWLGHPFHPLAKSLGGFGPGDVEAFSPERRVRFRLSWLLAEPETVDLLSGASDAFASARERLQAASGLPPHLLSGRALLPCHPWQAERLRRRPDLERAFESRSLILTGPSGDAALPTSSVRTVWFRDKGLFVKLALEARITNFSRVNTYEQIARSVASTAALLRVAHKVAEAGLSILAEPGGGILRRQGPDGPAHHPETGFLLRDAAFGEGPEPFVVAGLLEPDPRSGQANLATVSADLGRGVLEAGPWIASYTDVVLLPLLRLFETTGIALEAHAQNSLVAFRNGRPSRLFVRDLEGAAVERETFEAACGRPGDGSLSSALFYERDVVWRRFLYYVVVNHFAHAVSTVSRLSGVAESELWTITRQRLEPVASRGTAARALLATPRLPAKANLFSCLADRGEQPDFVMIPNPLAAEQTPQGPPDEIETPDIVARIMA